ncbi:MAG: lipid II flippase MurJ [Myxococcota bacterium]
MQRRPPTPDPITPRGGGVGRTSLLLLPLALASRGAAFLVQMALAWWYGVGWVMDAWGFAYVIPTLTLVLAGTSLGTAALPALARVRVEAPERLPRFIGGLMVWSGLAVVLVGGVVCLFAPTYLAWGTRFDDQTATLAAMFLWELLPLSVLLMAGSVLRVSCEVHGQFVGVTVSPILRTIVALSVISGLMPAIGPHALPIGIVSGEVVQVMWWLGLLMRAGVRPKPTVQIDPEVRRVGRDLAPVLGGEMLVAMNIPIDLFFASTLEGAGNVSTLWYADNARVIPQTLLQNTLAMVAFASWANLRAAGHADEARRAVEQSLQWTMAMAAPVLAGMFIGRFVLISILFEHNEFLPEHTVQTAGVLAFYLPGILPNLLGILAVRAHIIERNLQLVFWLGVTSMVCNALLNLLLIGPLGLQGLALATTLNMLIVPTVYILTLQRYVSFQPSQWVNTTLVVFGCVLTAVVVEVFVGAPRSLWDLSLWAAAVVCFTLLGIGWSVTKAPTRPAA